MKINIMVNVAVHLCWILLYWGATQATNPCPSPPCLFYTDTTTIKAFRLNSGSSVSLSTVKSNLRRAAAIAVDVRRKLLFWSDLNRDVIQSLNLTTGHVQGVVRENIANVKGMAVDWETGLVYWTDYGRREICVVTYDGAKRKTLITDSVVNPHGIAVDPRNGIMFWTELGSKPRIQKATLSGHNQTTIYNLSPLNQRWPHGITIDYTSNRLYWIDSLQDEIMSVDFNGKNLVLHRSFFNIRAFSLDMYGDLLYWSDSVSSITKIKTINKNHGGNAGVYYNVGYSADMGIVIYDQSRQPRGNTSCLTGNHDCQYLCLLSPHGRQCACPDGQILNKDDKTCKEPTKLILLTKSVSGGIYRIPLEDPQPIMNRVPLSNIGLPEAVDFNPIDRRVYWSDSWQRSISRAFLNGTSQEKIVEMVRSPDGLAVDWVAGNLYWTDRIANKIEVAKLDGKYRKTLIYNNLESPTNIVLDLRKRYLYWGSGGRRLPPRIEQADMAGRNRRVLANLVYPAWPTGVTIFENRLYWVDHFHYVLQYIDRVTPRGVVTLHLSQQLGAPWFLTSLDGFLYLLNNGRPSNNGGIVKIDKNTGRSSQTLTKFLGSPFTIVAVDFNVTSIPVSHACSQNNGNCSHLCLLHSSGRKCACPSGMTMKDDGITCYFKNFLLYADAGGASRRGIYKLSLDDTTNTPVKLPLSNIKRPTALDFDPLEKFVYWTDVSVDRIMRAHLDGSSQSNLITSNIRIPQGLAVDVIGRNLYWTDMRQNVIEVVKLNGSFRKVLVSNLDRPKAIILDGKRGYMYWSSWGHIAKIERADMDGKNRTVIKSFPTQHWRDIPPSPNGLALDPETNLLYWIDELRGMIQYLDLKTEPYRVQNLISSHLYLMSPFGLVLNEENIYWSEQGNRGGIFRTEKRNGNTVRRVARTSAAPRDVHVYHNATAIPDSHPCTLYNGWCTHLCLVVPGGYKCACPDIPTAGRPCLTVPNRPNITSTTSIPNTVTSSTTLGTTMRSTTPHQTTTTKQPTTTEEPTTTTSTPPTTSSTSSPTSSSTSPSTSSSSSSSPSTTTASSTKRTTITMASTKESTTATTPTTKEHTTTTTLSTTTQTPRTTQTPQTGSTHASTKLTTTPTRNPCLSNPCNNKGKCVKTQDNQDSFYCQCKEGYASKMCNVFYGENKVVITFEMKLEDWNTPEYKAGMAKLVNEYCEKNDCQAKYRRRRRSSGLIRFTPDDVIVVENPKAVSNGITVQTVVLEPQQENQVGPRKPMSGSLLCAIMRDTKETRSSILKGYNILALNGEKEPKCVAPAATGKNKGSRPGDSSSSGVPGSAAGAVVGVLFLLVLVIIAFYIYRKRKTRRQKEENDTRANVTFSNPGYLDDAGVEVALSNPTYEEIPPQLRDEILGLNNSLPWQEDFSGASNPVYCGPERNAAHGQARSTEGDKLKEQLKVNMKLKGDSTSNGNHGNSRHSPSDGNHGNVPSSGNLSNSGSDKNEDRYVTMPPLGFQHPNRRNNIELPHRNEQKEPEYASIPTGRCKPKVDIQEPEYASIPVGRSKASEKANQQSSKLNAEAELFYENMSSGERKNEEPSSVDRTLDGTYIDPESLASAEGPLDDRIYVNADEINGLPLGDDPKKGTYVNADVINKQKENSETKTKSSLDKQALGNKGNKGPEGQEVTKNKGPKGAQRASSRRAHDVEGINKNDETKS